MTRYKSANSEQEQKEREADYFAMCLLMPDSEVYRLLKAHLKDGYRRLDDKDLQAWAKHFGVTLTTLTSRLQDLGLLDGVGELGGQRLELLRRSQVWQQIP